MTKRTEFTEADYVELSARMQAAEFGTMARARIATVEEEADLDAALAATDTSGLDAAKPTPKPPAAAVTAAEVEEALRGRPTLGSELNEGTSPKRQVRLPRDLNQALTDRAVREHRSASEIMRDALKQYLEVP